jgi:hypothetical protein
VSTPPTRERVVNGYLQRLPGGLRRSLFAGRWLPLVGAGISNSAETETGGRAPTWTDLGAELAVDVPGTSGANPLDSISAFADLYGRPALIDRLNDVLLIDRLRPSAVHLAFARLKFDMVVTTNVDFLLEEAYRLVGRQCVPLVGETQLPLELRPPAAALLKFHGDLRHPNDLVMTEEDYDGFLRRRPLLMTYLSWWMLTREPVLFGYSLDDADLREVLAMLRDRLGRMTRAGWAVLPTDPFERRSKRFARRGFTPIVLEPGVTTEEEEKAIQNRVLADFFVEVREAWQGKVAEDTTGRTDPMTAEMRRA